MIVEQSNTSLPLSQGIASKSSIIVEQEQPISPSAEHYHKQPRGAGGIHLPSPPSRDIVTSEINIIVEQEQPISPLPPRNAAAQSASWLVLVISFLARQHYKWQDQPDRRAGTVHLQSPPSQGAVNKISLMVVPAQVISDLPLLRKKGELS